MDRLKRIGVPFHLLVHFGLQLITDNETYSRAMVTADSIDPSLVMLSNYIKSVSLAPAPAAAAVQVPVVEAPVAGPVAPSSDAGVPDLPDLELMENASLDSRLLSTEANVVLVSDFELKN